MTKKLTMTAGTARRAARNLALLVAVAVAIGARAATETVGGYTWTYRINGDTAGIYIDGFAAISPTPTGAVTIPSTLGGKPVMYIGIYAFRGCSGLTSVTIPDSVTSIEGYAFDGCSGLTSVTIPDSVTSIGIYAFRGCSGLTSVTIPDSVTSIEGYAFDGCNDALFDTATIPGVKLVDRWAVGTTGSLSGNLNLTGVRGIGGSAFLRCSGLTSVTIPSSVTSIGSYAFNGCSGLTSVTIPSSVTSIGSYAFNGCNDALFDTTTIPGVKLVDGWAVGTIGSLSGNLNLTGARGIGSYAFNGCSGLTSVTIPDSVTSIGYAAFWGCSGLASITLPFVGARRGNSGSSDSVFGYIFGGISYTGGMETVQLYSSGSATGYYIPTALKTVTITDETVLGYGAFNGCSGLTRVTIPSSVTSIGSYAFNGCSGLMSISVASGNAKYKSVNGLLLSKDGKTLLQSTRCEWKCDDPVQCDEHRGRCVLRLPQSYERDDPEQRDEHRVACVLRLHQSYERDDSRQRDEHRVCCVLGLQRSDERAYYRPCQVVLRVI